MDAGGPAAAEAAAPCPRHGTQLEAGVHYMNLTHSLRVPPRKEMSQPQTLPHAVYAAAAAVSRRVRRQAPDGETLHVLQNLSGVLRAGTSTLLLAAPGAGSSTFLRLLSGRTAPQDAGAIRYHGLTRSQLRDMDVNLKRLACFCPEYDEHEPLLTVRETFDFVHDAARGGTADACTCPESMRPPTPAQMLKILGLEEAADTYVGNNMVRGVSGGQRRRVTLGEALLLNSRVLTLDSVTAGLDAATALDIISFICTWTRSSRATTIIALQQPTPEIVACFDEIILLADGVELFHGPVHELEPYLLKLGLRRPSYMDLADFASEVVASPLRAWSLAQEDLGTVGDVSAAPTALRRTAHMAEAWQKEQPPVASSPAVVSGECVIPRQYALTARPPLWTQIAMCLRRQFKLLARNRALIIVRCVNAAIMALILGTLAFNADRSAYQLRFGLAFFASLFIAFTNNAEVPATLQSRAIAYKQTDAGLYTEVAYVWCVVIANLPLAVVADFVFGTILYWMTGWARDAGRFFFFVFVLFWADVVMAAFLRGIMYAMPTQEMASAISMGVISLWILYAGIFVVLNQLPIWLRWIAYTSPFRWVVTGIANNEFSSPTYITPEGVPLGELFMSQFEFPLSMAAKWGAIIFMAGMWFLLGWILSPLALRYCRHDSRPGTVRTEDTSDNTLAAGSATFGSMAAPPPSVHQQTDGSTSALAARRDNNPAHAARDPRRRSSFDGNGIASMRSSMQAVAMMQSLHFPPVCLAFYDLQYTVITRNGQPRTLLRNVHGWAAPRTLTALMGASGAGKTTLLDVLAFRKTTGTTTGTIAVNGESISRTTMARISAYCEQEDIHMPTATVREAVEFSARLRMEAHATEEQRRAFVQSVVRILELHEHAGRVVNTLSRGERKRLTIAVELASLPSLLFVDEPTTGLDSRNAAAVMRVLRRVADSGRTVVATIHQPSGALFFDFDNLLLLVPGGYQVYFGRLGRHARYLVQHLEALGAPPLPPAKNPASWMLENIGGGAPGGAPPRMQHAGATESSASGLNAETPSVTPALAASAAVTAAGRVSTAADVVVTVADGSSASAASVRDSSQAITVVGAPATSTKPTPSLNSFVEGYRTSSLAAANVSVAQNLVRPTAFGSARTWNEPEDEAIADIAAVNEVRPISLPAASHVGAWKLRWVYGRAITDYWRNGEMIQVRLLVVIFLAVLFGISFMDVDATTFQGTQSTLGFILGGTVFGATLFFSTGITAQFERREVYYRERASRYYPPEAYSLSAFLVEAPYVALLVLIFVSIAYWTVGLRANAGSFFFFYLGALIMGSFFTATSIAYSGLIRVLPVAQIVGGLTISINFLFAGLFIPRESMPAGWVGLYYSVEQFFCTGPECPVITTISPSGPVRLRAYDYVAAFLRTNYAARWREMGIAVAPVAVMMLIAFLTLRFINHQRR